MAALFQRFFPILIVSRILQCHFKTASFGPPSIFIFWMLSFLLSFTRGPKQVGMTLPPYTPRLLSCIPGAFRCTHEKRRPPSAHSTCCFPQRPTHSSKTRARKENTSKSTYCQCTMQILTWKFILAVLSLLVSLSRTCSFRLLPSSNPSSFTKVMKASQSRSTFCFFWLAALVSLPGSVSFEMAPKTSCIHRTSATFLLLEAAFDPSVFHGAFTDPT